ncbi:uncharacterized protein LOC128962147 [Oppia nitens]|uniref:uncharacterized protein LOC128962147 n=1 Tax=Oppia nitens TaxID=1686743 RepID=UPI0023DA5736|nr:uncharacterized protein LOC128962147 [Oppia nitens]
MKMYFIILSSFVISLVYGSQDMCSAIGSAIANPVEIGDIISGATDKLVAIPISVGTDAFSKFAEAAESGRQIWDFNVQNGGQVLKNGIIKVGHILLKPMAVVFGAHTALKGAGIGIAGSGIKGVGIGMKTVGAKLVASGTLAKALGHRLIVKNLVPPFVK